MTMILASTLKPDTYFYSSLLRSRIVASLGQNTQETVKDVSWSPLGAGWVSPHLPSSLAFHEDGAAASKSDVNITTFFFLIA